MESLYFNYGYTLGLSTHEIIPVARLYGKFLENGSTDGLTDAEQEAARKADKQKIFNKIDTDELLKLRGGSEDIHIGGSKSIKNIIEMLKVTDLNSRRNLE